MKISSASKKVLASALSAAMVVAFAPTVAFGAQVSDKVTVTYDLAGGKDANAANQNAIANGTVEIDNAAYYTAGEAMLLDNSGSYGKVSDNAFTTSYPFGAITLAKNGTAVDVTFATTYSVTIPASDVVNLGGEQYVTKQAVVDAVNATYGAGSWSVDALSIATGKIYRPSTTTDVKDATATLKLADASTALVLESDNPSTVTVEGYAFNGWEVSADLNADGKIADDEKFTTDKYGVANFSGTKWKNGQALNAKATFDTETIASCGVTPNNDKLVFTATMTTGTKVQGTPNFVVTAPDKTTKVTANAKTSAVTLDKIAAQVGTYTIDLVDGNGIVIDTEKVYIGSVTVAGGAISIDGSTDYVTSKTAYYEATGSKTYKAILGASTSVKTYKLAANGSVTATEGKFYNDKGAELDLNATTVNGEKGAVATTFNAAFDASIAAMTAEKRTVTATAAGIGSASWATQSEFKAPATVAGEKYYLTITDASGKVVAARTAGSAATYANADNGTYTATLYKVGGYVAATGTVAAVDGKTEVVDTKTVTVDAVAAAPTFEYAATYKTDGTTVDYGMLTFTNNAGEGFKVVYNTTSATYAGTWATYDAAKGGIKIAGGATGAYYVKATNGLTGDKLVESNVVTLKVAAQAFANIFGNTKVGSKAAVYYKDDAAVKAAQAAGVKALKDAGYKAVVKAADGTEIQWFETYVANYRNVLVAAADVAKAEINAMAAGIADAKGDVSILTKADTVAALAGIDAVVAAFDANNDGNAANDHKTITGRVGYDGAFTAGGNYITALNAVLTGVKTVKYAKADVDAAAAVTAQLKDPKTAAAGLKAYAALTATQKELVSAADVAAAEAVIAAAEVKDAQDEAAVAKTRNASKTVKAGKAGKTTKKQSLTLKKITSKSGAKVTYKKTSGKKAITVKSGKAYLAKGVKKGTYKATVKATCGTQTAKITVKFVVK